MVTSLVRMATMRGLVQRGSGGCDDWAAISPDEASRLIRAKPGRELRELLRRADEVRTAAFGAEIGLCAIISAKSGRCSEDCHFCAQSCRATGDVLVHSLLPGPQLTDAGRRAEESGASAFSMVTAGRRLGGESEYVQLTDALESLRARTTVLRCASLGLIGESQLQRLRKAGLQRYHCNLEAPPSFFPRICTTHTLDEKLRTIAAARSAGLSVCSGGIFGMGETPEQRVELACMLGRLEVDAVPINFLDPRPGTPLAGAPLLSLEECLATIAVFRLMLPEAEIIIMGGREVQLRNMQSEMFRAGASGTLVGNYLTTRGSGAADTLALIEKHGFSLRRHRQAGRVARVHSMGQEE
jgi:biotin synthase